MSTNRKSEMGRSIRSGGRSVHFASVVPQFAVEDVVQTAEYYRRVLGFTILGYWDGDGIHNDSDRPAVFGIVERDRVRLHFSRSLEPFPRGGGSEDKYDAYFHVSGIDRLADELRALGADILDGPADRAYGQRELVIRDANGLVLAFGQPIH